jgi:DNA segregation ATPase FtsK/SpoIIIE-like protein
MSEITLYEAQKKKLQGLCEEHELTYRFRKDTYPITLTISPLQGVEAQMTMLEESEETGYRSPESSMTWIFEDGNLTTRVSGGTFTISKVLRTKIESVLLKMISFWQQYFFRDVIEKDSLRKGMMPVINEAEANDPPDGAEPLEEYEMEDDGGPEDISTEDPDIQAAIEIVRAENKATTALLQRRMSIGYAKAARIMDALEELGIVGPFNGGEPREVLPADEPEDEG